MFPSSPRTGLRKHLLILCWILAPISLVFGQKDIYEHHRFDELAKGHRILAIVPFLTHLDLEQDIPKNELKGLEEKEGEAVQNALETYFSQRKKKKKFSVEFQNTKNTNAILAQHHINYGNIDVYTVKQLCEILEVDGIISGNLYLNILLSEGVSTDFSFMDYFTGNADFGHIGIKISDGTTGKLLWKYEKHIDKKTGRNTYDLIDRMMKAAARKFPYDREKRKDRKQAETDH